MGSVDLTKKLFTSLDCMQETLQSHHEQHEDIKQRLDEMTLMLTTYIGRKDISGQPVSSTSSFSSTGSERQRIQEQLLETCCMRDAIQQHIVRLVESLPFAGTNIPDLILEKGIADETDAERLRNLKTTEDQISGLISLVLKGDKACMNVFLEIINPHCEKTVQDIKDTYDCIVQDSDHSRKVVCSLCQIKSSCDVKWVYNHLFEKKLISADFHRKIAFSSDYTSSDLWDELLQQVTHQPPIWVLSVLVEAVKKHESSNGTLLLLLKRLLRKGRHLKCNCRTYRQYVNTTGSKVKSDKSTENSESGTLQISERVTNEPSLIDDSSNAQRIKQLKTVDEKNAESNTFNCQINLLKETDETIPKDITSEQSSNDYETIWPIKQNISLDLIEKQTVNEATSQGEAFHFSPELTRKGSGSNETQVKRAIGNHDNSKKFHRKHYDMNKFKEKAIRYQMNEQRNVDENDNT